VLRGVLHQLGALRARPRERRADTAHRARLGRPRAGVVA
jgi:hypothetical protein